MSVFGGPNIIEDGLVLCLDAGNTKSYPGTGTTWTDLTRGGNTGTLSGPAFSSANRGYFTCNGTSNYVLANNTSLNSKFSSTSVSHFIWFYPTSAGQIVSELGQTTINANWHDSNIEISTGGAVSFGTWANIFPYTNKVTSSNLSFNTWYYMGFSYNGTTLTAYINGSPIGTTNFTRQAPYNNGYQTHYALCATDSTNMGTGGYAGGQIGSFVVYNRALAATEVLQNFNAIRGRYDI